jgi:hypothetical protein
MESLYEHEKQKTAALEKALLEQEINFSAEKDLLIGEIKNMRKNEEIYELKIKQERELRKKEEDKINEFNEGNIKHEKMFYNEKITLLQQIEDLKEEQRKKDGHVNSLRNDLEKTKSECFSLQGQLKALQNQLQDLNKEIIRREGNWFIFDLL